MSLSTPTTQALADDIVAQLETSIAQTVPLLPKAFCRVLAKALSGVLVLLYKYIGWGHLQMFVAYASADATIINGVRVKPLVEHGRLIGVGDPLAATRAEHTVNVSVLNQTGSLPAASQLLFPATGVLYLTTSAVALNAATVVVTIRAASDQAGGGGEGSIGNLTAGDIVSFANPLPNVATNAVILARTVDGADAETTDAYRTRVVERFQRKPQGGAYADYEQWAEGVAGIVAAYPYTGDPGEVNVYVEATEASSGSADGIPTSDQLDDVRDAIRLDSDGLATRRPAGAAVNVLAITRTAFDLTISGLAADDTAAAEAAISSAVDEYLRSREPFIVGLSFLPRRDRVTLAAVSGVVEDAISSLGGTVGAIVMELSAVPTVAYSLGQGEKAKAGVITYA